MNVTINGKTIRTTGKAVSIVNGRVTIDGVPVEDSDVQAPHVNVTITGNVHKLEVESGQVMIDGDVEFVNTQSGSVDCHNVGNASTMSGNINAGTVRGNASSMSGNIYGARR